jgi:excinuclease ABC subunit C
MFDPKPILVQLPSLPGVYRMKNAAGEVIYVGKARDLKKRVSSYFQKTLASPRTELMVSHIADIETTVTRSEAEALLLENNLIKSHAPRYNVLFRDDKSYPYIMITGHEFPQIRFYRGSHVKPHRYFGPFPSAWAVRDTIGHLQKVFKLRTCDDTVFAHRARPCLLHQIGRCSAPCVKLITDADYARDVGNAELFLSGKENEVVDDLSAKMENASTELQFERAAAYRDQIRALQRVLSKTFVESTSQRDVDVIAAIEEKGVWCVNLAMIRGGRHLGDRSLFPTNAHGADYVTVLGAFIEQHYGQQRPPSRIVIETGADVGEWEESLTDAAGYGVKIITRPSGETKGWFMMAHKNAAIALQQRLSSQASQEERLTAMQEALGLSGVARIECFDISHTMGEATVASCVVYDNGKMQSSEYRRFNITGITPGDDYAAMRDALTRRYRKLAEQGGQGEAPAADAATPEAEVPELANAPDEPAEAPKPSKETEAKRPDLILIDGGKGQLSAAQAVMNELGLTDIMLIGVAKGEERKPGLEQLIFSNEDRVVQLPSDHPGLHLIQQVRDEAHRFAITGHRARRAKARNTSRLEDISSIGPKRRQSLLKHFGGMQGVLSASVEDLAKVEGISQKLAQQLYDQLH